MENSQEDSALQAKMSSMKTITLVSGRLTPKALSVGLIAFIFLACVMLVTAIAWQLKQSADERLANAKIAAHNIVRASEQQAQDTIRQAENILDNLVERFENDRLDAEHMARLSKVMASNVQATDGIQGLFIYDEHGDWVANSFSSKPVAKNNSDRSYFIYHKNHPGTAVRIGEVILSRTTGDMIIPVSRRTEHSDGSFSGVVLATLPVAYFQSFFNRLDVDKRGVILLALSNGDLLARRPMIDALMTTNISKGDLFSRYLIHNDEGTATLTSVVDGVERVYAYSRIQGLPLVTAAGLSLDSVFATWWTYVYQASVMVVLIIFVLTSLGFLFYRQIQRVLVAEEELRLAHCDLEHIAKTDSLTGLPNRRCFDSTLEKEWSRACRTGNSVALILIDIDWFKQYNDHYGHVLGDECLRRIAELIGKNINRPADLAARYGGEEFVILLPETELSGAVKIAEEVRSAIEAEKIAHQGSPVGFVTISAGVSSNHQRGVNAATDLLEKADGFLYGAKKRGRNRVEHQSQDVLET
ncbi:MULTISPECIES: GGDEF domain-containing protein [unclassified Pseudomonas]|uniref:sensor domain-containing diguanylate cyclase n=1 Tax=unclassified Pseudomonas TaxID=196821 RepID=UPI0013DE5177|nr:MULTISPECIES: GGDEF domain-containing protein [unclassified Pseudomonas]